MNKIYQKSFPDVKNSSWHIYGAGRTRFPAPASQAIGEVAIKVIAKGCSWVSRSYKIKKRLDWRTKTLGNDKVAEKQAGWLIKVPGQAQMYKKRTYPAGFTLIELLVVVLIIGILSAIALPQYQTAVKKTKLSRYFPLAATIAAAEEAYFLENAQYTPFSSDLAVALPEGTLRGAAHDDGFIRLPDETGIDLQGGTFYYPAGNINSYVQINSFENNYRQYFKYSAYPGRRWCGGDKKVCQSLGATTAWNDGWMWPEN